MICLYVIYIDVLNSFILYDVSSHDREFTCNDFRSLKALSSVVCIVLLCSINSSKFSSPERSFSLRTAILLYLKCKKTQKLFMSLTEYSNTLNTNIIKILLRSCTPTWVLDKLCAQVEDRWAMLVTKMSTKFIIHPNL